MRVVLIGCGAMGEIVARGVYARPTDDRYRVVAVIDTRPERAAVVGEVLGVPGFGSLAELDAAGIAVDAADVRLPHHRHAAVALDVLGCGLHLLVEKPLATSLADAAAVVEAADRAGVVAAVAENYPHVAAVRAAAEAIGRGDIGTVLAVRSTRVYTLGEVWRRDGWRQDGGPSSGILLDQGTHHISLLRQLCGEITGVSAATSAALGADTGETIMMTVTFRSGLVGQALYCWGSPARDGEPEAMVFGSAGRIDVHIAYQSATGRAVRYPRAGEPVALSPAENYYDSHRHIVDDWIGAIAGQRAPVVPVADALVDLAVVLAAGESIERGGVPVSVPATRHGGMTG